MANLKFRTLLYSVTRKKPTLNLEDGVFYNGIEGHAIRAAKVDKEPADSKTSSSTSTVAVGMEPDWLFGLRRAR